MGDGRVGDRLWRREGGERRLIEVMGRRVCVKFFSFLSSRVSSVLFLLFPLVLH